VTYLRSREARMEESTREADVYDRVYDAARPELFFKASAHRVVGHGAAVRIRADSSWNVPEAELALAVNCHGEIFGYSIGNDMSSRSIEGEIRCTCRRRRSTTAVARSGRACFWRKSRCLRRRRFTCGSRAASRRFSLVPRDLRR
jgi:fumarylacetoacetate (FAA) hydrolase family protein